MEELRSWWEVPSIAHFCSLFRAAFDLSDFDIEDLEEGLLDSLKEGGCEFLTDLVCKLLNGCYGREDICAFNYDLYIKDIIKYKWDSTDNPILKKSTFSELTLREKVEVIHSICEYRLDGEDVMELLKGFDGDSMRVEPLGKDKEGGLYWYFYGSRLYKEDPEPKKELTKEQKRKEERQKRKERRKEQLRKKKLEKEQRKQEKVQRRIARRVEKKRLLEMRKREQEEESQGKRRRSGRIQKIQEQQLMESESSTESSSSEEESDEEENSSEDTSEEEGEEQDSDSETEVEEQPATEDKTPKKETKKEKETPAKTKKTTEKPAPIEKKAGKRQPLPKKRPQQEEDRSENSRRSGRLRQKNTRSQIDNRDSDSGIDDSDHSDDDTKSVQSEVSRRSVQSVTSVISSSAKKEPPKRSSRSKQRQSESVEKDKPSSSKSNSANSESTPARGRGRPRKTIEPDAEKDKECNEQNAENEIGNEQKNELDSEKPRGRGRPRKSGSHGKAGENNTEDNNMENNTEKESGHESEKVSEIRKGRGRPRKIDEHIDDEEKNSFMNESDNESRDSEKAISRGRPRKNASLNRERVDEDENELGNIDENGLENEVEKKAEGITSRRRSLRSSTESRTSKDDNDKSDVCESLKTEVKIEQSECDKQNGNVKVEVNSETKIEGKDENKNETEISETLEKDESNKIQASESLKKETISENEKTADEKDFSEAKSKVKSEPEMINGEDSCDINIACGSAEIKEEKGANARDSKEESKNKVIDKKDSEDDMDVEKKPDAEESPETKTRPKPTPPPKSKTESRWHLICTTLDDWINLAEWFKESTVRCEKALNKVIEEDFLPVLPEIIETREKEKLRRQRENELRKSARITQKQREKLEQEKILAEAAAAEEQARKEAEEEKRLKEEQERLEHENKLREERVKAREERAKRLSMREERARLVAEGKEIPPELIYTGLPAQRYKDDFDSDDSKPDILDDESFEVLMKVIDGMKNHKESWPFLEPVTEEQAPGYHDVIKRPMDLSRIEKKVELREYRTQHHFLSDFRLMFNNCRRFNGPDSDFTACAKIMEKHLKNLVKKHLLEEPTDAYYDDEDYVTNVTKGSQGEKKIRPKRQAGTKALQTVQRALKDDDESSSEEEEEEEIEPVKKKRISPDEAISPSVRSLLLQEMIEFKRKRAEQRTASQTSQKLPVTQGIMIMPREEIPTDGVLRLAASREIRWKIDPKNVSLKQGLSSNASAVIRTPDTVAQQKLGKSPSYTSAQSQLSTGQVANSSFVRPQTSVNVVHRKTTGLAPGQKIIKILASAPGSGIHAVRQTAESVKVSSDGYLILNGKQTNIKVTPNTKIVIQPQGTGNTQETTGSPGLGSDGAAANTGSNMGKEVVIKKIPTPAGLQPLSDMETSVTLQPTVQGGMIEVPPAGPIPQRQETQNPNHFDVSIGQAHGARMGGNTNQQPEGMVPSRVAVQTQMANAAGEQGVVNVARQQGMVASTGNIPTQVLTPNLVEARKRQLDIAQRLIAAKRRQLMQNGPISPKVARLETDTSSPLKSSPNILLSQVANSNRDSVNSLTNNVVQNVNISSDILDSYYSVMNETNVQKTDESDKEFIAVPLTSIQQSQVQRSTVTDIPSSQNSNVSVPQHTPVNIDRLLHSTALSNTVSGIPVGSSNVSGEINKSESHEVKTMSLSALTTALARSIAAGNIQFNRTASSNDSRQQVGQITEHPGRRGPSINYTSSQSTSQTGPILPASSGPGGSVVINMDAGGSISQQYLQVSQPLQTTVTSPPVTNQISQIVNQPIFQKPPNASISMSDLLKATVISNSNLLLADSAGHQNQTKTGLTTSVPQPVLNVTTIQNKTQVSENEIKPIEALLSVQSNPVILSPTKTLSNPVVTSQFPSYKTNISPHKSDRQSLFDMFETGKDKTGKSPTKSDDFGFASLIENKTDQIPQPARHAAGSDRSIKALKTSEKAFIGSPLNTSVMEALRSKLSPGKPQTSPQTVSAQAVAALLAKTRSHVQAAGVTTQCQCIADHNPCCATVVEGLDSIYPAQDNLSSINPVELDHELPNHIDTNNNFEIQTVTKCINVKDKENIEVEAKDRTIMKGVLDSNMTDIAGEGMNTAEGKEVGTTTKYREVEFQNPVHVFKENHPTAPCVGVSEQDKVQNLDVETQVNTVCMNENVRKKLDFIDTDSNTHVAEISKTVLHTEDIFSEDDVETDMNSCVKIEINDFLYKNSQLAKSNNEKCSTEIDADLKTPEIHMHSKNELEEVESDETDSSVTVIAIKDDPKFLDFSSPKLLMSKNQEPAMVLTIKGEEATCMSESPFMSSLEHGAEIENKDKTQPKITLRKNFGTPDSNLEEYLSTCATISPSSLKKTNEENSFHYACKTDNSFVHRIHSKQGSLNKSKPCKHSDEEVNGDQCPKGAHKKGSDEEFEEQFYRSLLCRQKAADSAYFKSKSMRSCTPFHNKYERYLGLTVMDNEHSKETAKGDKTRNIKHKSTAKRTAIDSMTKEIEELSKKNLEIPESDDTVEGYVISCQPNQSHELPKEHVHELVDLRKTYSKSKNSRLLIKTKFSDDGTSNRQVWHLKFPEDANKKSHDNETNQKADSDCTSLVPIVPNCDVDAELENFHDSNSHTNKFSQTKRKLPRQSCSATELSLTNNKNESLLKPNELTSNKTFPAKIPVKRKWIKGSEKLQSLVFESSPKFYKVRGVSSDSAINNVSNTEESEITSDAIRWNLKRLQNQPVEGTPLKEWKLGAVHSDSMVEYTVIDKSENGMLNGQGEEMSLMEDEADSRRVRTIPYSRHLSEHSVRKRHSRIIVQNRAQEERSIYPRRHMYKSLCKKSLSFPNIESFGDANTCAIDNSPLLDDMHVNVVCSSPSPSFINHFIGGGDMANVESSERELACGSLTLDEPFLIDNLNLSEFTESDDTELYKIADDIFDLQEQYQKLSDQTITSPLPVFASIAPNVCIPNQTQGDFTNKTVVIGNVPESLRQLQQKVQISISEDNPGKSWQETNQNQGTMQSKVVVQNLPQVQTLFRPDTLSAIASNLNPISTSISVSNSTPQQTIESIFASNNTDSSAAGHLEKLIAASVCHQNVHSETKPIQTKSPFTPENLLNSATYLGTINLPNSSASQPINNPGQSVVDNNEKLGALEAMFLKGLQGIQQTGVSQVPAVTTQNDQNVTVENGGGKTESDAINVEEYEFTAEKLEQT